MSLTPGFSGLLINNLVNNLYCFISTGICLLKLSTVMSELFLCCCAVIEHVCAWWVDWCLNWPETVFGSAFLLLLCILRHTVFIPGPNDGLHFFLFWLWVSLASFYCAKTFVVNLFNALFNSLNLLKFKRVIC